MAVSKSPSPGKRPQNHQEIQTKVNPQELGRLYDSAVELHGDDCASSEVSVAGLDIQSTSDPLYIHLTPEETSQVQTQACLPKVL